MKIWWTTSSIYHKKTTTINTQINIANQEEENEIIIWYLPLMYYSNILIHFPEIHKKILVNLPDVPEENSDNSHDYHNNNYGHNDAESGNTWSEKFIYSLWLSISFC